MWSAVHSKSLGTPPKVCLKWQEFISRNLNHCNPTATSYYPRYFFWLIIISYGIYLPVTQILYTNMRRYQNITLKHLKISTFWWNIKWFPGFNAWRAGTINHFTWKRVIHFYIKLDIYVWVGALVDVALNLNNYK